MKHNKAENSNVKYFVFLCLFVCSGIVSAQKTPLEMADYKKLTMHSDLSQYIQKVTSESRLVRSEVIAKSVKGREVYALYFSRGKFGEDKSKIKVLIFCQQHGNEQSGKEGALLLIENLLKPENAYLFDKIDFVLVPQMNPDGGEINRRRNGNGMDLNRNHLILTEPETIGLQKLFDTYLFEVTMDVHEYSPYGGAWEKFGYRANNDEEIGTTTNINVSEKIRDLSTREYLPYIKKYLNDRHFSCFEYSPGGPPEGEYIRRSTFDINDGRQSFGIQNSFSFIQEGLNGADDSLDNIKHRAEGQMTGMMGLVEYAYHHKYPIKKLVAQERAKLTANKVSKKVAIQLDHFPDGRILDFPLYSYATGKDTVIKVKNYRPVVKALTEVDRPLGYLVPRSLKIVVDWARNHSIYYADYKRSKKDKVEQYFIAKIDSMDFEGDTIVNPIVELKTIPNDLNEADYIFIPVKQLKNNMIVIALEPKSELGLVTYKKFELLLKKGEVYPIYRVTR